MPTLSSDLCGLLLRVGFLQKSLHSHTPQCLPSCPCLPLPLSNITSWDDSPNRPQCSNSHFQRDSSLNITSHSLNSINRFHMERSSSSAMPYLSSFLSMPHLTRSYDLCGISIFQSPLPALWSITILEASSKLYHLIQRFPYLSACCPEKQVLSNLLF